MNEKIFVTQPFFPDRKLFDSYVDRIWEGKWLTNNGPLAMEFENKLIDYLQTKNVTLTVNGHLALEIAVRALDLTGEVITTPFTFASTTHSITSAGLTPVFCDIDPETLTIDVTKIETLITDKTSAIAPVHVYGHPCNVREIERIAKKYNLKVIYDAAHAFGVKLEETKGICEFGDISMLSFHATKLFNTIEGGALAYNGNYKRKLDLFKNFGIENEDTVSCIGLNAKMNEFQAAMGLSNIGYIDDIICRRKVLTGHYRTRLDEIPGIRYFVPEKTEGVKYNYSYMPVCINPVEYGMDRNALYLKLKEQDIFARKYFYPITSEFDCYKHLPSDVPEAKKASESVLCLPIYYDLTIEQIDRICDIIKSR
ncbi:MAG: DegT/DnrJ/EryC1/StrS family aminotransferase [Candidatus Fimivivens sp.]|nr:DegT/DnrJ/EryC1/StrS family aminotransferase [Candidatus Fimivivens sp.]